MYKGLENTEKNLRVMKKTKLNIPINTNHRLEPVWHRNSHTTAKRDHTPHLS